MSEGTKMRNLSGKSDAINLPSWRNSISFLVGLGLTLGMAATAATGPAPGQQTFASPGEAVEAMVAAANTNDMDTLMKIFGPDGKQVLSSGDEVTDKNNREIYRQEYEQMHRLVKEPDGSVTLYVGAAN